MIIPAAGAMVNLSAFERLVRWRMTAVDRPKGHLFACFPCEVMWGGYEATCWSCGAETEPYEVPRIDWSDIAAARQEWARYAAG